MTNAMAPEKVGTTCDRLDEQLERHHESIERAVDRFGLPLHVIFLDEMQRTARRFLEVLATQYPHGFVAFAAKSNPSRGALRAAQRAGLGADVASEYEFQAALEEGIDPTRILCNGNAKTDRYLHMAAEAGALVAVDNEDEWAALSDIGTTMGREIPILFRFRGMPLSGFTSDDQSTAADWTKFGFPIDESGPLFERVSRSRGVRFAGISAHVGTQIADPAGYERLAAHFVALGRAAQRAGLALGVIDLGGGYPVSFLSEAEWQSFRCRLWDRVRGGAPLEDAVTWNDQPMGFADAAASEPHWIGKAYWSAYPGPAMLAYVLAHRLPDGRSVAEHLRALGSPTLVVEPGRSLTASAGITLTEVMGTKTVLGHAVVSLDMGINNHGTNLITSDLFPAAIVPRRIGDRPVEAFLAGRLCFSGDMVSKTKVRLNRAPRRGERLVLYHTGAYSADHFASNSCGFPRPGKVAIAGDGRIELWRRPETFADVFPPIGEG